MILEDIENLNGIRGGNCMHNTEEKGVEIL